MNLEKKLSEYNLGSSDDVLDLFLFAISYRSHHKDQSATVAEVIFDATHPLQLNFTPPDWLEELRFEFGALEAPGAFDYIEANYKTQEEFEDVLWERLRQIVTSAQEKRRL